MLGIVFRADGFKMQKYGISDAEGAKLAKTETAETEIRKWGLSLGAHCLRHDEQLDNEALTVDPAQKYAGSESRGEVAEV